MILKQNGLTNLQVRRLLEFVDSERNRFLLEELPEFVAIRLVEEFGNETLKNSLESSPRFVFVRGIKPTENDKYDVTLDVMLYPFCERQRDCHMDLVDAREDLKKLQIPSRVVIELIYTILSM